MRGPQAKGQKLKAILLAFGLWLLAFGGYAFAQARTDLQGTVPGDALGWEIHELRTQLVVSKTSVVNVQIYSPGFDPSDYRSALKGKDELGDERYDGGKGRLQAEFVLWQDAKILAQQTYGIEPHRWVLFFRGTLQPGVYTLGSAFSGNGKNTFRYRIQTSVPVAAELLVDPTLQLYTVRTPRAGAVWTFTTHLGGWVQPFKIEAAPGVLPFKVGFYDENGPKELESRVLHPDGRITLRTVSGDRSWALYQITEVGLTRFEFRQPATARQYSNTIGFKVNGCLEVSGDHFKAVLPRAIHMTVEAGGQPLDVPLQVLNTGDTVRSVSLNQIPGGYVLQSIEQQGGSQTGNTVSFGCAGGSVRFVLQKTAPAGHELVLKAVLVRPYGTQPLDMPVQVGDTTVQLKDGQAKITVTNDNPNIAAQVSGARVQISETFAESSRRKVAVLLRIFPEVKLSLESDKSVLKVGQEATLTLTASSDFAGFLPADLSLSLPDCLQALGSTELITPVSSSRRGVLQVRVKALCKGEFAPTASLSPWNQQAQTLLKVLQPATFTVQKVALKPQVRVGEQALYQIRVQNVGDEAGEIRVQDTLTKGLLGSPLEQTVRLEPGAWQTFDLSATVGAEAPPTLVNTATLLDATGQTLAQAQASLQVLRPVAQLTRFLDKRIVVPGEVVTVRLEVANKGQAALSYTLTDTPPEWLEPLSALSFQGQLEPGQTATHTYTGKVRFGPEADGQFQAQLLSNGGSLSAPDTLKRVLVGLEKTVRPDKVLLNGEATFVIRLTNPTDHPLSLELQEAPDPDLNVQLPDSLKFDLAAGESRELGLTAKPQKVGVLENQATAFVNGIPASAPAKASLTVLPILEPLRLSTVRLEFVVKGAGERLLLTHLPPAEAQYEPGSARLDGNSLPDPLQDSSGRLYFELPYQTQGVLTYVLRHHNPLPELLPPTLTLRSGDREVFLQGQQPFASLEKAQPLQVKSRQGFIQEPLPGAIFRADKAKVVVQTPYGLETRLLLNGNPVDSKNLGKATYDSGQGIQRLEYYGLPLQPGRNLIEVQTAAGSDRVEVFMASTPVKLEVRPLKLLADGRTPVELEILALDANGLPSGFGPLTLETSGEPLSPDAFPDMGGYQLLLKEGRAILRLKPLAAPAPVRLKLAFGELKGDAEFYALGKQTTLWQFQGSVGVSFGENIQGFGVGRGYLEAPLGSGILRGALDDSLSFDQGNPQLQNGLNTLPDPTGRFPLTGSGTEAQPALRSDDPIALRYDENRFSLGYYAGNLALAGLPDLPQGTALRVETRGDVSAQGFVGWLPLASKTEIIVPDGTRYYTLSGPAEPGSETVLLYTGATSLKLQPLKDYVLDPLSGIITLAQPLWPNAPDFQPVRLQVSYAPLGGARALGYGVGAKAKLGGFSLGGGMAFLPGVGWSYGAEAGLSAAGFSLSAQYNKGLTEHFGLEASGQGGKLETSANLSVDSGGIVQGAARVAYTLSDTDKLSLEHTSLAQQNGLPSANQTGLLYLRRLDSSFSVGAGLGYTWETAALGALGRLGYKNGPLSSELTHSQPFSTFQQATTRLRTSLALDSNTSAVGDVLETWGQGLSGTLGLKQKLGGSNLSLDYQLPAAAGEGNRARFGLETPLPLDNHWGLNASAGLERDLNAGINTLAFGLATRYQSETFSATLGGETAWDGIQTKVVLRAGATGQLDAQQTLSVDTTYQIVPTAQGSFTVAYALRGADVSLLTYHRLTSATQGVLEGSVAASYHPDLSFQLRPSLAYRSVLGDPGSSTFQLGLGGNYYFTDRLGAGATFYYQFQPSTHSSATTLGLEGSLRIVDGLWFNLGYVFGGFQGLTPETNPGFYIRLDFLTGGQ
ncbi:MAG: DUF11 domain-containing protein [Thermaceae bacterium]|nr:DUF11 domain-containing protein [Thermaceae bacterium]